MTIQPYCQGTSGEFRRSLAFYHRGARGPLAREKLADPAGPAGSALNCQLERIARRVACACAGSMVHGGPVSYCEKAARRPACARSGSPLGDLRSMTASAIDMFIAAVAGARPMSAFSGRCAPTAKGARRSFRNRSITCSISSPGCLGPDPPSASARRRPDCQRLQTGSPGVKHRNFPTVKRRERNTSATPRRRTSAESGSV